MPNFFLKINANEAEFLIKKPLELIIPKLKGPVENLYDSSKGSLAHWFAKNPKTLFMEDKLKYLWDNGIKKELKDHYNKYAVEYLLSHLERELDFITEYNDFYDEERNNVSFNNFLTMGEREIYAIKNIMLNIGFLLPKNEFLVEKKLDVKIKEIAIKMNKFIKFEDNFFNFILNQQLEKNKIEEVTNLDIPEKIIKKKRL